MATKEHVFERSTILVIGADIEFCAEQIDELRFQRSLSKLVIVHDDPNAIDLFHQRWGDRFEVIPVFLATRSPHLTEAINIVLESECIDPERVIRIFPLENFQGSTSDSN